MFQICYSDKIAYISVPRSVSHRRASALELPDLSNALVSQQDFG